MEKFYDIEFNPSNNSVFNFNDGVRIVLVLKNKLKLQKKKLDQYQLFKFNVKNPNQIILIILNINSDYRFTNHSESHKLDYINFYNNS